ncbi:MAG: choice-of-anchor D domain-containing protein [Terracidiphilus sp.]
MNNTAPIALSGNGSPQLTGISCSSSSVVGTATDLCTVTISGPAPAGGFSVGLSSDNAAVTISPAALVQTGTKSAQFPAYVTPVSTAQPALLTASAGSVTETFALQLNVPEPTLTIGPASVVFGNVTVNTPATQTVTLSSTGTAPVTISGAAVTGTGFTLVQGNFPLVLNPGQTVTLGVQFDPTSAGQASGHLTIVSDSSIDGTALISLSGDALESPVPADSVFAPPAANACQSNYDQFYGAEPGVYAYWSLCEAGSPIQIYDYVGEFDLTTANQSWGSGVISGGTPGPVPDGETAASVPTASFEIENQGIPLNTNQGTVAAWINSDTTSNTITAVFLNAFLGNSMGKSTVSISVSSGTGICFNGSYINAAGRAYTTQKCGYIANTWHRVAFTWFAGGLSLYVDGNSVATGSYTGALDNAVFDYRLFPGCCNTGKQMTLAKVSIANQAWSASQVMADFSPSFPLISSGSVYVSAQILGTIHRDILGYADASQYISSAALKSALLSGLTAAGFTSLRYGGGRWLKSDLENWQSDMSCTSTLGVTAMPTAEGLATGNNIDTYLPGIAQPLGLDVDYIVNYGTNPTACDAGGDPIVNGADLVKYSNLTKGYGIKYFEIGNELFSNNTETDFHPNPNTGTSYATYEPAFYTEMKAKDPSILIGVPIGLEHFDIQSGFDLPVLAGASFDAVVWHNYPVKDPITDGATLYPDRVASNMGRTRGALLKLQTELLNNGKNADAIWVTEWSNSNYLGEWSKQSMGAVAPLFAATQLAEYMQAGVQFATWSFQGMTDVCSTLNYDGLGESAYSWWECGDSAPIYAGPESDVGEVVVGLQPGGLTPTARAFQILSQSGFVTEGEHMVRTQADAQNAPWLLSYAATHGPSYAVILINRDRDSAHTVPVTLAGMTSGSSVQQWSYGRAQYDESRQGNWTAGPVQSTTGPWSGEFQANLPPWSVNVLVFVQ